MMHMRLDRAGLLVVAALALSAAMALAQDTYKAEASGSPPADLPKAVQDALQPAGARLVDGHGAVVCEMWLRKSVPAQEGSGGSADVLYPGLGVGTMIGVVRFPNGGSDFRGQPIKPGVYTLRYAQIPQDGNHMGVSTYRDFLLLGPAATDADFDKAMNFDGLVKLSRQASGTGHPSVLSLDPAADSNVFPTAVRDDQGHWALLVKIPGTSSAGAKEFPMGIVIVGKTEAG